MRRINVDGDRFPMACRSYRLGYIRAKKILGLEPMLEEYDDYMEMFVWGEKDWWKHPNEWVGRVTTDLKGDVVSIDV